MAITVNMPLTKLEGVAKVITHDVERYTTLGQ